MIIAVVFAGLWCGAVVTLSGFMGVMAGQRQSNLVYIVSFLLMNVLTLAAISLLLIFAATGLARDSDTPYGYFIDQEVSIKRVLFHFDSFLTKAMKVNAASCIQVHYISIGCSLQPWSCYN